MTNHEAEARPRRFTDQRGIALQTVIIMVVLLAIAGAIAAVLLSRGNEAATQLEGQNLSSIVAKDITSESLCTSASGLKWDGSATAADGKCQYDKEAGCISHGGRASNAAGTSTSAKTHCHKAAVTGAALLGKIA